VSQPIQPTGRFGGMKRIRGKREPDPAQRAGPAEAAEGPAAAAPIRPASPEPEEPPPVISVQILGQAHPAESPDPANMAGKARAAYLDVEWSGPADRRNRRGRIAKTEV
jgi:hypothetical protein